MIEIQRTMKVALFTAAAALISSPTTADAENRVRVGAVSASFEVSVVPAFYLGWHAPPPPEPPPPPTVYPQVYVMPAQAIRYDPCGRDCGEGRLDPRRRGTLGAFAGWIHANEAESQAAGVFGRWDLGHRLQLHGEVAELSGTWRRLWRAGAGFRLALRPGRRVRPYGLGIVGIQEQVGELSRYFGDVGLGVEFTLTRRLSLQGEYRWTARGRDRTGIPADTSTRTGVYKPEAGSIPPDTLATLGLALRL